MITHDRHLRSVNHDAALVFLTAVLGRLPALGAWWNRDDWGLLARASGLIGGDDLPARWLSTVLYWDLGLPLFGLSPDPWTWTRLLLHGAVAALTVRLAARLDFGPAARLAAGLLVVVTPLAFTPLYWAAGVQELLGAALALAAIERVLAGGGRNLALAAIVGTAAILSKENALLLPLLLGGMAAARPGRDRRPLAMIAVGLGMIAIMESLIVLRHFALGGGSSYVVELLAPLPNLTQYGWWMITPWPTFTARWTPLVGAGGLAMWSLWGTYAWHGRGHGDLRPLALFAAAMLSLAPVLALRSHVFPYYAYLAWIPAALTLAGALCGRLAATPRPATTLGVALLAAALAWGGTTVRLKARGDDGLSSDPTVLATALSHHVLEVLTQLPGEPDEVVILRPDVDRSGRARPSRLHAALAGDLGLQIGLPDGPEVRWAETLTGIKRDVLVVADDDTRIRYWGPSIQARLNLVLTRIGQGRPGEAADLLLRTLQGAYQTLPVMFDASMLTVPIGTVIEHAPEFLAAIDGAQGDPHERAALRAAADRILEMADVRPDPVLP